MTGMSAIEINADVSIPRTELEFSVSRSAGPGGQHVNKVSSRVTLHFDLERSESLTDSEKRRIAERLPTRITRAGVFQLHCQKHRSQSMNRELAVERFAELLRDALKRKKRRRKTRVSKAAKQRRVEDKRRRSAVKRTRAKPRNDD
jgi:ribosome-associated protein